MSEPYDESLAVSLDCIEFRSVCSPACFVVSYAIVFDFPYNVFILFVVYVHDGAACLKYCVIVVVWSCHPVLLESCRCIH